MASPESTPIYHTVFALLRSALWGEERYPFTAVPGTDWAEVYGELCHQTVEALPADILGLAADPALQMQVLARTSKRMTRWYALMKEQQSLFELFRAHDIPFVVLKGAAADIYYPQPMYRVMGDVDVIVKPEDFERAYELMSANGYVLHDDRNIRHLELIKNGVLFELHRYFSTFNDVNYARLLDGMIFDAIDRAEIKALEGFSFPMLPPLENGLVLLEHINHHLEEGLGLRQIIDWMLYVDRELDDEFWQNEFGPVVRRLGLTKLILTVTRMCQIYLGLNSNISWCAGADPQLCKQLIELILEKGNFGKKVSIESNKTINTLQSLKNIPGFFIRLHQRGCFNWHAVKKYPFIKPFAWFYQICRYISLGLRRKNPFRRLWKDVLKSHQQDELLEKLEISRRRKGLATTKGVRY